MNELLPSSWLGNPDAALLVLLATGHVLGDFLFQTRRMVERKPEIAALGSHAGVVLIAHWILVLPFLRWSLGEFLGVLGLLVLLGALHALIDVGKVRLKDRLEGHSVGLFLGDQLAHGVSIVGVWMLWRLWLSEGGEVQVGPLAPDSLWLLTASALVVGVYVLNGNGAATLIKLFLSRFPVLEQGGTDASRTDVERMGRMIGILERMLVLSLVLLAQWQAIGWIFAGKTVARFRELDNRAFSEYYLIGTLSSLLFATATGAVIRLLLTGGF